MLKFRGITCGTEDFVYGNGVFNEDENIYVLDNAGNYYRIEPETYSVGYPVFGTECVYVGDIIRYTFKHKSDYYNVYYVVKETGNVPFLEEMYRDYEINEDMNPVRCKSYSEKGKVKPLTTLSVIKEVYKVIGDIWHNKEELA